MKSFLPIIEVLKPPKPENDSLAAMKCACGTRFPTVLSGLRDEGRGSAFPRCSRSCKWHMCLLTL